VINGVSTAIFPCDFLRKDFEVFGHLIDLGFVAA
jgi:hypothetical protein